MNVTRLFLRQAIGRFQAAKYTGWPKK